MARRPAAGFTLIELVVVMILVGILAAVAIPRMVDRGAFDARGFRDETVALLRYAQKAAVAQRRTVCVAIAGTGATLKIADTAGATTCGSTTLQLPATPRGGTGLGGSNFNFLASGGTDGSGTLSLTVTGSPDIQIDAVTGYVR